jgi:hypothetical protein
MIPWKARGEHEALRSRRQLTNAARAGGHRGIVQGLTGTAEATSGGHLECIDHPGGVWYTRPRSESWHCVRGAGRVGGHLCLSLHGAVYFAGDVADMGCAAPS